MTAHNNGSHIPVRAEGHQTLYLTREDMKQTAHSMLALDMAYKWEQEAAHDVYLTQPMNDGSIETYTWQQVLDEARRIASYLESKAYPKGSHIALLSKNCAHWVMFDLAIWMSGHVSVPLYPTLNADTVAYILEHCEAKLLFVGKLDDWGTMGQGVPESLPVVACELSPVNCHPKAVMWQTLLNDFSPLEGTVSRLPAEVATIVYTSGSTGKPKGVMLSFENMAAAARGVSNSLNVSSHDRMLSYLPLSHVLERMVVEMGSLQNGFQLFFADSLDSFLVDLNRAKPTIFLSIPRLWTKFQAGIFSKLSKQKLDLLFKIPIVSGIIKKRILRTLGLQHVRYAASGSAPLSADTISWYRGLGLELLEGYGMSENFGYSHMSKPGRSKLGFVGEPLPGVECCIGDNEEILVRSNATTSGYYKADKQTAEAFTKDGFLRTGDRGEIDELGRLKITGRTKELFKTSKGKYVAPAPIENLVVNHPDIEVVCVAGEGYPQPYALVMLAENAFKKRHDETYQEALTKDLEALRTSVNQHFDPHEHLSFISVVSTEWGIGNGFLTPTMKLKRDAVESAYKGNLDEWYGLRQKVIFE